MDEGLLSALGAGFQGMGAVASPAVAQRQAQERENALPNLIKGLQIRKAVQSFQADQQFSDHVKGKVQPGMTSSAMLDAVSGLDPSVLSESPAAQQYLQMVAARQTREHQVEQERRALQAELDKRNKPTEHMVNGKLVRSYPDGRTEVVDTGVAGGNTRFSISPKDYTPESVQKYSKSGDIGDLVPVKGSDGSNVPSGYRRTSSGNLEYIPGGPADPKTKEGKLGNRESVFLSRVMTSANEAAKDLANVVRLPMTASSGVFGGRQQGAGLFDATREVLANKLTTQEVQSYNVRAAGFQRSLAAIEAAGLAPSGTLSHQMDAVIFKEGDTNFTKLEKLAQTRQIVEAGLETAMSNPRVPEQQLEHMKSVMEQIKKAVPFTIEDLDRLRVEQRKNPKATLKDVMAKMGDSGGKGADVPIKNAKGWTLHVDAQGNKAYVGPNNEIEEVK